MKRKNVLIIVLFLSNLCFALTGAKYLIITPDAYVPTMQPLADWKTKKGVKAKIAPLSVTGSTAALIKSYIANAYNTWDIRPEYILIAGYGTLVTYSGNSDDYYADMSGTYQIELSVGRLPFTTQAQCSLIVAKTLGYERTPYVVDTTWTRKGTTLIDEDGSTQPDTVYWNDARYCHIVWRNANYFQIDSFSRLRGNTATDVINAINNGRAYVMFRGQAVTNWGSPFTINPDNTSNGFKLPMVVSPTCATMGLLTTGYQGDRFLNAGSAASPKGSVGYFGTTVVASGSGLARLRGTVGQGFFRSVFKDGFYKLGDAARRAKFIIDSIQPPYYVTTRYSEWQLFGDPELNLWTGTPRPISVVHDTVIEALPQIYTVTVTKLGSPVVNALVCLMKDTTIYQYNLTNSSGVATFSFTPPVGTMSVTVTGQNCIPYESNVRIIPGNLNHDVGVMSIIQPQGTIATGTNVIPKAKVKNYTNHTDTFPATFKIGTVYTQVYSPVILSPNDTMTISFPSWTAVLGNYNITSYTALGSDQWRGNDTVYGTINVVVPNDVGVDAILKPDSSLSTNTVVIPQARIKNFGSSTQYSFPVTCSIIGATGVLRYTNTQTVSSLSAGDTIRVNFSSWTPTIPESCVVKIRTNLIGDQNPANDQKTKTIRIIMVFFAEGFNGATFPPTGWQSVIVQGSYNWVRTTSNTSPNCTPYEGDAMAFYPSYSATSGSMARLISQPVTLGSTPIPCTLKFWMYHDNAYPGGTYGPDSVKAEYSTNGSTFNEVTAFRRYEATNGWVEHTVYLGSFSGTLYVGLLAYSQYGDNMNIDYVRLIGSQIAIKDVGIDTIIYPAAQNPVNNPIVPIARVKNYGNTIQSNFPVVCSIVGSGGVLRYTNSQNVATLSAGDTTRVNFATWTPNVVEMCTVKMRTSLVSDQNLLNDLKTITTQINPTINIISPNGGECWGGSSNQIVKWRTIGTGFARYRLLLSRNSGATYNDTIVNNIVPTETTYNWAVSLINYTTCRVIIQVLDGSGTVIVQDASDADFIIDSQTPSVPTLILPTNNFYTHDSLPRFWWHRSTDSLSGINNYQLQYATNSGFVGGITINISDTTYQVPTRLADTTYYWHVKAIDRAGNQGNWSLTWCFEIDTRAPQGPSLVSPINGIWLTNTLVIFNWSQVTFDAKSPVRYLLQIDTTVNFTNSILDTTSLTYDTLVLNQTRYYWRVCTFDLAGNQGAFSLRDSFGIDLTAPSVPNLVSPNNSSVTNNPNVTFIWKRSTDNISGIDRYTLEYAKNSGFVNPKDTIVTDTIITVTLTDTTFYWRVKSQDRAGNQSSWSASRSFEIDTRIPNTPVLILPINGPWLTNTLVIFNWLQVGYNTESPVKYMLQVDTLTNFTSPIVDTTSLTYDTLVLSQARYYWRVRAYDLAGNQGAFSGIDSFGVDITPPSTPNLISPTNNIITNNPNAIFVWSHSTDNMSGVSRYTLQTAMNSNFVNPKDTVISDTIITLTLTDTTYYWRVRAYDLAGNQGAFSNPDSFSVDITAPSIPVLVCPANGFVTNDSNITFTWYHSSDNFSGVAGYTFEYSKDAGFFSSRDTINIDTTIVLILNDTSYYWRVKAEDGVGNWSAWSSIRTLEVDTRIPNTPVLISPINATWLNNSSAIFNWSQVVFEGRSMVRYILQVDTNPSFSSPITDTTGLISDTIALNQGCYYWRIRAFDFAGNQGVFSGQDSFGIDIAAPSVPILVSPANNVILTDSFVMFTWNRSSDNLSGVRNYRIQIANNSIFVNPIDTLVSDSAIMKKLHDTTYYWRVKSVDKANNESNWSNPNNFRVMTTSIVENIHTNPNSIILFSLTPNPVLDGFVKIAFSLDKTSKVNLKIYDVSGKLVRILVNADLKQGLYNYYWDRKNTNKQQVKQGVYIACLETSQRKHSQKFVFVR